MISSTRGRPEPRDWWVSCPQFTVWVQTSNGIILDSAPIVHRFIGQPLRNLIRWKNCELKEIHP